MHAQALVQRKVVCADRNSLRCVYLLCPPEHASPSCMTAYDARALAGCSSLTSLTLPIPPSPAIGWNLLGNFPFLTHFDCATAGASVSRVSTSSSRSSRSHLSNTTPSGPPLPFSSLPALSSVSTPWTALSDLAGDNPDTLTALRLHGAGPVHLTTLSHITRLTGLRSLDCSSPLRWSVDSPGTLPNRGPPTDTVQLPSHGCSALESLRRLRSLSLSGSSRVDDCALAAIATLTALTELDLSVCRRLDDAAAARLPALTQLQALDLAWCTGIGSPGAAHVGTMRTLRTLDMSGCLALDDSGAFKLASLTLLTRLQLRGCPRIGYPSLQTFGDYLAPRLMHVELTSETDAGAGIFSLFTPRAGNGCCVAPLTHLTLRGFNKLPDSAFSTLSNLRGIRALVIDCCPLAGGAMVESIAPLTTLTRLVLRFCAGVTDASLKHLAAMSQLQVLSLQGSKCLYGGGLRHIGALSTLWSVDLQQCLCLDACGLGFLSPLPRLSVLNVSKCDRIEAGDFAHLTGLRALPHLTIHGLKCREADAVSDMGFHVSGNHSR